MCPIASRDRRSSGGRLSTKSSARSEEHPSVLQSPCNLVCRLLLEKKKTTSLQNTKDQVYAHHKKLTYHRTAYPGHVAALLYPTPLSTRAQDAALLCRMRPPAHTSG